MHHHTLRIQYVHHRRSCRRRKLQFIHYSQEEYTWHPIETCKPLLEKTRYVSFAHPEHSTNEPADSSAGERHFCIFCDAATDVYDIIDIFKPPTPPLEDLSNVLASLSLQGAQIAVTPVTKVCTFALSYNISLSCLLLNKTPISHHCGVRLRCDRPYFRSSMDLGLLCRRK